MAEYAPVFKKALYRCRESLVADLDFDSMCDHLISKLIFTDTKIRDIKDQLTTSDKHRKLIDAVSSAGEKAYKEFKEGLRKTKQDHLANKLEKAESELLQTKSQNSVIGGNMVDNAKKAETPRKLKTTDDRPKDIYHTDNEDNAKREEETVAPRQGTSIKCANVSDCPSTQLLRRSFRPKENDPKEILQTDIPDGPTVVPPDQTQSQPASRPETEQSGHSSTGDPSKYEDLHGSNAAVPMSSSVKQVHYRRDATSDVKTENGQNLSSPNENNPTGAIGQTQEIVGQSSITDSITNHGVPNSKHGAVTAQPGTLPLPAMEPGTTVNQSRADADLPAVERGVADLAIQEYLTDHFDACVLYTQKYRNRADEIIKVINDLPDSYKVCYFDDDKYFGLFNLENLPDVLTTHCVLFLLVISDDIKVDEDEKFQHIRVILHTAKSAKVRPVLFNKDESKYIKAYMKGAKQIQWYGIKEHAHIKENLSELLKDCRRYRIDHEARGIKTKKDIERHGLK